MTGKAARLVLLAFALGLAGCGFHPLYGSGSFSPTAVSFDAVSVAPIPGHDGLRLRNNLIDGLTGGHAVTKPRYRLEIELKSTEAGSLVQGDASITRYSVDLIATFRLIETAAENPVLSETSRISTTYNVPASPYASTVARDDAVARATHQLADDIRIRVASFLESRVP